MPNPVSTEAARQARVWISSLQSRAHALTSYTGVMGDDVWRRRLESLQAALDAANALRQSGNVPADVLTSLETTIRRTTHTATEEERESLLNMPVAQTASDAVEEAATGRRAPRRTSTPAATPSSDPETASILPDWSGQWEEKGAPSELWAWLNPPGAPLHRKPIVIGAAALGAAGLIYGIVKKVG